jgi:hypothetical protein
MKRSGRCVSGLMLAAASTAGTRPMEAAVKLPIHLAFADLNADRSSVRRLTREVRKAAGPRLRPAEHCLHPSCRRLGSALSVSFEHLPAHENRTVPLQPRSPATVASSA